MESELIIESVFYGQHMYKEAWRPFIGQILSDFQETDNRHDRRAITVFGNGTIVGRVPRGPSEDNMSLFMRFVSLWTAASKCVRIIERCT